MSSDSFSANTGSSGYGYQNFEPVHGTMEDDLGARKFMDAEGAGPIDDDDLPVFRSDDFRMFCMKIVPCSKRYCHDWTTCPFAHPGEKATRRDPRLCNYTGIACPDMKKNSNCIRGEKCPYAHNVFEYWLHPTRYRTQLCNDGVGCGRKVCFFAHTLEELRIPPCKPYVSPEVLAAASLESLKSTPPTGSASASLSKIYSDSPFGLTAKGPNSRTLNAVAAQAAARVEHEQQRASQSLDSAVHGVHKVLPALTGQPGAHSLPEPGSGAAAVAATKLTKPPGSPRVPQSDASSSATAVVDDVISSLINLKLALNRDSTDKERILQLLSGIIKDAQDAPEGITATTTAAPPSSASPAPASPKSFSSDSKGSFTQPASPSASDHAASETLTYRRSASLPTTKPSPPESAGSPSLSVSPPLSSQPVQQQSREVYSVQVAAELRQLGDGSGAGHKNVPAHVTQDMMTQMALTNRAAYPQQAQQPGGRQVYGRSNSFTQHGSGGQAQAQAQAQAAYVQQQTYRMLAEQSRRSQGAPPGSHYGAPPSTMPQYF